MLNDDFKRETKIYWLNWKELQVKADLDGDDTLYDRTAELARMIKGKCGDGNFLDWTNEELLEERLWDMAVLYHIRNRDWKWRESGSAGCALLKMNWFVRNLRLILTLQLQSAWKMF